MKVPDLPNSDDPVELNRFYSGITGHLICQEEMDKHLQRDIKRNRKTIKRTGKRLGEAEEYIIQNQTAWTVAKVFIVSLWLVFTAIFSFVWNTMEKKLNYYVSEIERHEDDLNALSNMLNECQIRTETALEELRENEQ